MLHCRKLENRVVYDVVVRAQNMFGLSPKSELFNFYVNHKGRKYNKPPFIIESKPNK